MIATLRAEQIKLRTTAGPWAAMALFTLLSLAYGLTNAYLVGESGGQFRLSNTGATAGVQGLGLTVLPVLSALVVTQEFRYRTILASFQATPRREVVLAAKALLMGGICAGLGLLVSVIVIPLAALITDPASHNDLGLATAGRPLTAIAIACAAAAVLAVGVGALARSSAVAVGLLVVWQGFGEMLLRQLPEVGTTVAAWLPFENASYAMSGRAGDTDFAWGPWGALAYFVLVSLAVFGAGVLHTRRGDA